MLVGSSSWSAGALPMGRRLVDDVGDHAMLLGLSVIWTSNWVCMCPAVIGADDICAWPYSVGFFFLEWVAFSRYFAVAGFPELS